MCLKYVDPAGQASGGLFHALIDFGLPDELRDELERERKKQVAGARLAGPVPLLQAVEDGEDGLGSGVTAADWADYGYQVRWSLRDGPTVSVPLQAESWTRAADPCPPRSTGKAQGGLRRPSLASESRVTDRSGTRPRPCRPAGSRRTLGDSRSDGNSGCPVRSLKRRADG